MQVADASLVAVSREWAALRIQTAFRSFLVFKIFLYMCVLSPKIEDSLDFMQMFVLR